MQDFLKDIVQHTLDIDTIKITGDENQTTISAMGPERKVILEAKFKTAHPDFVGVFGMPNLGKLKTILGIEEYAKDAKITINRQADADGNIVPSGLHFENATGDFKNDYRYMTEAVINTIVPEKKFRGARWGVDFQPSTQDIQRMRYQAAANNEETTFTARTENGNLVFYFGDPNSHTGNFVFKAGVAGTYTRSQYHWPVQIVLSILSLAGDKTVKMSDDGATLISVDSGLIEYNFILPAQTK